MHLYELQRNAKIEGMGLADQYPVTHVTGKTEDAMFLSNEELGEVVRAREAVAAGAMSPEQAHDVAAYYRAKNGFSMGPDGSTYRRIGINEVREIMESSRYAVLPPLQYSEETKCGYKNDHSGPSVETSGKPVPSKHTGLPGVGEPSAPAGNDVQFC